MSVGRRAVGGHLTLTDRTLSFRPHFIDRALRAKPWSVPVDSITSVTVTDVFLDSPPSGLFDGSVRRRLRVCSPDGDSFFVVPKVEAVASRLNETLGG
jgi:hypothetical protein